MPTIHKVLIIGVGSIGERHLRCFQNTQRVEVALVETNEDLRQKVSSRHQIKHAYKDLEAGLAFIPDVAVIATPAPLHVPMATRLAEAGIHPLIEKPLSVSLDGVEKMRKVIAAKGLKAAVAYVYRAHPLLVSMRNALASGRFGKPVQLVAVCGQHFPTYRPAYRDIYYKDRALGGGAIQDALTHVINAGEWLIGPVQKLVADAAHQVLEGVAVEDTVHVLTRQGPAMGSYSLNQYQAPNEITITVVCDQGAARFESHRQRWRWMLRPEDPWQDEILTLPERDSLYLSQAHQFLDVVEGKAEPLCSLDAGIQTLKVNLAALASVANGDWQIV